MLNNHMRPHFGTHAKVQDVTFADIDSLHRKITKAGHCTAQTHYRRGVEMFSLAVRWGMRPDNPCKTSGATRNQAQAIPVCR